MPELSDKIEKEFADMQRDISTAKEYFDFTIATVSTDKYKGVPGAKQKEAALSAAKAELESLLSDFTKDDYASSGKMPKDVALPKP